MAEFQMTLGWVIVYVDDPPAAADFYERVFGLAVEFKVPGGEYAQLDTGSTKLAFATYTLGRHARLLSWCQMRPDVCVETLGESVEGRPIDMLRIGQRGAGKLACWITAGQHPGGDCARHRWAGRTRR